MVSRRLVRSAGPLHRAPDAEWRVWRRATSVETPVVVTQDPQVQLSSAEYRALHAMRLHAARQQARVQAVVRSAELLKEQMTEVKNALKNLAGADSLSGQATAIDKDVDDILKKVRAAGASSERCR